MGPRRAAAARLQRNYAAMSWQATQNRYLVTSPQPRAAPLVTIAPSFTAPTASGEAGTAKQISSKWIGPGLVKVRPLRAAIVSYAHIQ